LAIAAVLGGAAPVAAFDSECETKDVNGDGDVNAADWSGIVYKQVTYEGPVTTSPADLRANSNGVVRLRGWLYHEAGKDIVNARVLIYNHGHDQERGEPCAIARFFVKRGFVVFAPLRRGHVAKTPGEEPPNWNRIASTGMFTDDYVQFCSATNCIHFACNAAPGCSGNELQVDYIRQQVIDVADQIQFIKAEPAVGTSGKLADPQRIAVLGHSFGGSLALFANAGGGVNGHAVAISVSGAELSWDQNPYWAFYLTLAVAAAQRPMYFLQPKNGRTLNPTRVLSRVAIDAAHRSQAAIFAAAPWNPDSELPEWEQAHGNFIGKLDEVQSWGPSVIDFLRRNALGAQ
jgi:pimeloyl-ACP methyl ester carboxylesterase